MHPHSPDPRPPNGATFPNLPIVTPDPPRKTEREKYGGLFYLGIAGLVVLLVLLGWFAHGVWSLRAVWGEIYVLHSSSRSEEERVNAAYALSRDPRVTQRDDWEMCLRKPLPELARYLLAERITADTVAADPRAYALTVVKSDGWPPWLRAQLTRPLAYAAARDVVLPREPLLELSGHADPVVALWADFALAAGPGGDAEARARLQRAAEAGDADRAFAQLLLDALNAKGDARTAALDQATLWERQGHADSARVWDGWHIEGNRLVHAPTPNLPREDSEAAGTPSR